MCEKGPQGDGAPQVQSWVVVEMGSLCRVGRVVFEGHHALIVRRHLCRLKRPLGGVDRQFGARRALGAPDGQEVAACVGGLVVELETGVRLRVRRRLVVLQQLFDGDDLLLVQHPAGDRLGHKRCDHGVRDGVGVVFWEPNSIRNFFWLIVRLKCLLLPYS